MKVLKSPAKSRLLRTSLFPAVFDYFRKFCSFFAPFLLPESSIKPVEVCQ